MKIQSPWMGRVRGSAGNMTGCKVFDKNVLRAKAFEVSNPRTTAQVTQRDFFEQVTKIVSGVTEEQLRSLFGQKPKSMSRRNMLTKQVAAAYSIDGTNKVVDFSKLLAIGSGEKVTTPYVQFVNGVTADSTVITKELLNVEDENNVNLILVAFDSENDVIHIFNTGDMLPDEMTTGDLIDEFFQDFNGFAYVTCSSKGDDIASLPFGAFTIKTRSAGKQAPEPPQPEQLVIEATGLSAWDTFTFNLGGTIAEGGTPFELSNNGQVVCSGFNEVSPNVFTGSFTADIDESAETTLYVEVEGIDDPILPVVFNVQ